MPAKKSLADRIAQAEKEEKKVQTPSGSNREIKQNEAKERNRTLPTANELKNLDYTAKETVSFREPQKDTGFLRYSAENSGAKYEPTRTLSQMQYDVQHQQWLIDEAKKNGSNVIWNQGLARAGNRLGQALLAGASGLPATTANQQGQAWAAKNGLTSQPTIADRARENLKNSEIGRQNAYIDYHQTVKSARQDALDKWVTNNYQTRAMSSPDFTAYSKYDPSRGNDKDFDEIYEQVNQSKRWEKFARTDYNYNQSDGNRERNYLTAEEKSVFNYLYNSGDRNSAVRYLEAITPELEKRRYEADIGRYEQLGREHPVLASAGAIAYSPVAGVGALAQGIESAINGRVNPYSDLASFNDLSGSIKTGAKERITEDLSGINPTLGQTAGFLYDAGMSSLESASRALTNVLVPGSGDVGLVSMALSVAQTATNDYIRRGYSQEDAAMLGFINGLAEYVTENMGMERLTGMIKNGGAKGFKGFLLTMLKNGIPEAGEEAVSSIVDNIAELMVEFDKSEWKQRVNEYQAAGMDEASAEKQSTLDMWSQVGLDALAGFVSGGMAAGIGYAGGKIINASVNAAANSQTAKAAEEVKAKAEQIKGEVKAASAMTAEEWEASRKDQSDAAKKRRAAVRESGASLGVSEDMIRSVEAASDVTGQSVTFKSLDYDSLSDEQKKNISREDFGKISLNGYRNDTTGEIVLNSNAKTEGGIKFILGHELGHSIEGGKLWTQLRDLAYEYYERNGKDWNKEARDLLAELEFVGAENFDQDSEMTANFAGKFLLDNVESIEWLVNSNHGMATRVWNWINEKLATRFADDETATKAVLTRARELYGRALANNAKAGEESVRTLPTANAQAQQTQTQTTQSAESAEPTGEGALSAMPAPGMMPTAAQADASGEMSEYQQRAAELARERDSGEISQEGYDAEAADLRNQYRADIEELRRQRQNGEISEEVFNQRYEARDRQLDGEMDALDEKYGRTAGDEYHQAMQEVGAENERGERTYSITPTAKDRETVKNEKPVNAVDEVRYSITFNDKYQEDAVKRNKQTENVPESVLENAGRIREIVRNKLLSVKDEANLPEDKLGNTAFGNSAYGTSEENTSVCIRSLAIDSLTDLVAEELGRPLTVEESVFVAQEAFNYTDMPQCLYCYVAMDRMAKRELLGEYINKRDAVIENLRSGMSEEDALSVFKASETSGGKQWSPDKEKRFKSWVKAFKSGSAMLQMSDLASEASVEAAMKNPDLAKQAKDAVKYAQSASWAKKRVAYAAYNGHILKWSQNKIDALNSMFGLRMYSFSDYSPAFVLENMQMITDAAVRGLKMLAYTKDLDFVRVFADTGMNINISVFGMNGENGEVHQDGMQGANWEEAQALRAQHPNVGITFVATSDAQVDWALDQDWIDVVIPFHMVKTGARVAAIFGYHNYTGESSDRKLQGATKKEIYPDEHQNDREKYFAALKEANLEPRFERWKDHKNYMRLVNETRRSAQDTPAVQPVFNLGAALNSIDGMVKRGGYNVPIGGNLDVQKEIAEEFAGKIAEGMAENLKIRNGVIVNNKKAKFSVTADEDEAYLSAARSGDTETAQRMVNEAARRAGYSNAIPEQTTAYAVRTTTPPKKTIKVYKVFTLAEDGSPTALFVSGIDKLPQNVWLNAQDTWHFTANNGRQYVPSTQNPYTDGGKTGGQVDIPNDSVRQELIKRGFLPEGSKAKAITALAYRPGWHAGDLPFFPQGGMKIEGSNYENVHRYNQAVFECEFDADTDYTNYTYNKNGEVVFHDRQEMPSNGYYKFATNPMANAQDIGSWFISGSLKINRALTEEECNKILTQHGRPTQEWQQYQDKNEKRQLRKAGGKDAVDKYEHTIGALDLSKLGYESEQYDAARKTLAPITYDDNGDIIPLSERFNPENDDIRWSVTSGADQTSLDNSSESEYNTLTSDDRVVWGSEGRTWTSGNEKVPFRYAIVPPDTLIVSNDEYGDLNPDYPKELQPRDRTRVVSVMDVNHMTNTLNPERLAESANAGDGAPIIRGDGVVVGGNKRVMSILNALKQGKAGEYESYIRDNAERFGIEGDVPEDGVLVRIAESDDWADLAKKLNESTTGAYSTTEQAQIDADRLDNDILSLLSVNEDGDLNTAANRDFISSFIENVAGESERAALVNADGYLSQQGLRRVQAAVFAKAYGDASLIARMSESLDDDMKNVTKALMQAASKAAVTANNIANGDAYDLDVTNEIIAGVELYAEAKKQKTDIDDIAGQMSLDEQKYGDAAIAVAKYIAANKLSGAKIADLFNAVYTFHAGLGSPNQAGLDLFGEGADNSNVTVSEIFRSAARRLLDESEIDIEGNPKLNIGFKIEDIGEQTSLPRNLRKGEAKSINGNGNNTSGDVQRADKGRGRAKAQGSSGVILPTGNSTPDSGRYIDRSSESFSDIIREEAAKLGMIEPPEGGQLELAGDREHRQTIDSTAQATRDWIQRQRENIAADRTIAEAQTEQSRKLILNKANEQAEARRELGNKDAEKIRAEAQEAADARRGLADKYAEQKTAEANEREAVEREQAAIAAENLTKARQQARADAEARRKNADIQPPTTSDTAGQKAMFKAQYDSRHKYNRAKALAGLSETDWDRVRDLMAGRLSAEYDIGDAEDPNGVQRVFNALLEYDKASRTVEAYRKQKNEELRSTADEKLQNVSQFKDKRTGAGYATETQIRNIRDIAPAADAEAINQEYFYPIKHHTRQANDLMRSYNDRVRALGISNRTKNGNKVSEAYAVQFVGEMRSILDQLGKTSERFNKSIDRKMEIYDSGKGTNGLSRDEANAMKSMTREQFLDYLNSKAPNVHGMTYDQAAQYLDDFMRDNPNFDYSEGGELNQKIAGLQKIYSELLEKMNEVYMRWGYEPMGDIKGYFPHFINDSDTLLQKIGKRLGIDQASFRLPTEIIGETADRKPGVRWFANKLSRRTNVTDYDALEGFAKYIRGAADVIYHTEDIQKLRQFVNQIRYLSSDKAIQERAKAIENNPTLDADQKNIQLAALYEDARFALGNYVQDVTEYTNILANKRSELDRGMEKLLGRNRLYRAFNTYNSLRSMAAVAGNVTSALTNLIPAAQVTGIAGVGNTTKAFLDTIANMFTRNGGDNLRLRSDFLVNREQVNPVNMTTGEKVIEGIGWLFEHIDRLGSETVWRACYYNNLHQGMSENAAAELADHQAAGVVADRSKGGMPTIFHSKNPLVKIGTRFMLEQNNTIRYYLKDIPRERRRQAKSVLLGEAAALFFTWLYNEGFQALFGRRPAQEPSELVNDIAADITGYRMPNAFRLGGTLISEKRLPTAEDFKTEKGDLVKDVASDVVDLLPFSGWAQLLSDVAGFDLDLQGGRFEVGDSLPDIGRLKTAGDQWQVWAEELSKPVTSLIPGGNQIQKTVKGVSTMIAGGSYKINDKGERQLQYPAEQSAGNWARAIIAGKSSLPTAQEWVEKGFDTLSVKDTEIYDMLTGYDVKPEDALGLIKSLNAIQKTDEESRSKLQRKALIDSDIDQTAKLMLYYGKFAGDREMALIDEIGGSSGDALLKAIDGCKNSSTQGGDIKAIIGSSLSGSDKVTMYDDYVLDKDSRERAAIEAVRNGEDGNALMKLIDGVKSAVKTDEESAAKQKRDLLVGSSLSGESKLTLYTDSGLFGASEKEIEILKSLSGSADNDELTKAAARLKLSAKGYDDTLALMEASLPRDAKKELYLGLCVDADGREKKASQISDVTGAGLNFDDYLRIANKYYELNDNKDIKAGAKATEFSYWLDGQRYTDRQKAAAQEAFGYYSQVRAKPSGYEKMTDTGLSADAAYEINRQISALEPKPGKSQVSDTQKAQVIVSQQGLTDEEKLSALRGVYSEDSNTNYSKAYVAVSYGVPLETYYKVIDRCLEVDDDPQYASYKPQERARAVIDSFGELTNRQKAAIWQCYTVNWSAKSNPFDQSVGAYVHSLYYESDGKTRKDIMPGNLPRQASSSGEAAASSSGGSSSRTAAEALTSGTMPTASQISGSNERSAGSALADALSGRR